MTLFAQVFAGYSLLQILIFVIIIAAAVAITLAILLTLPDCRLAVSEAHQ